MSVDSCSYDCSTHPAVISPYTDISGVGVGVVASAEAARMVDFAYGVGHYWVHGIGSHCHLHHHYLLVHLL